MLGGNSALTELMKRTVDRPTIVYALVIFLGAFLLFQIQPLLAKFILPWFGGSTAVWTTCMLFFQLFLLAGYAYAHFCVILFRPKVQCLIHGTLLVVAIATLQIIPDPSWKPTSVDTPVLQVMMILTMTIGLPYLLLASTSPLLQSWFSVMNKQSSPYRLYALSNAGSLLGLLSYPVFVEPKLSRVDQSSTWSIVFGIFAILSIWSAWIRWRRSELEVSVKPMSVSNSRQEKSTLKARVLWVLLPVAAVIMLLAVTNQICLDVAVVPFLWILPLGIYLLSFIICFSGNRWYHRPFWIGAMFTSQVSIAWLLFQDEQTSILVQISLLSWLLLCCTMVCHGELYRLRPTTRSLTTFYLLVASGGAIGGLFVAVLAPLIFNYFAELQIGIVLCVLLTAYALYDKVVSAERQHYPVQSIAIFMFAILISIPLSVHLWQRNFGKLELSRSFYGVISTEQRDVTQGLASPSEYQHRLMRHGRITHGLQFTARKYRQVPTTYFTHSSGIGRLMSVMQDQRKRIGVVGLGIGTLAVYGRQGDLMRFYEINPDVIDHADRHYYYLHETPARIEVLTGDARLIMEQETAQNYDILIIDAFSGDAPPMHLLTREAFELYFSHLRPGGVIATNITNLHLDLSGVLQHHADWFDSTSVLLTNTNQEQYVSEWFLMSRDADLLKNPQLTEINMPIAVQSAQQLIWTDDYSNLLSALR